MQAQPANPVPTCAAVGVRLSAVTSSSGLECPPTGRCSPSSCLHGVLRTRRNMPGSCADEDSACTLWDHGPWPCYPRVLDLASPTLLESDTPFNTCLTSIPVFRLFPVATFTFCSLYHLRGVLSISRFPSFLIPTNRRGAARTTIRRLHSSLPLTRPVEHPFNVDSAQRIWPTAARFLRRVTPDRWTLQHPVSSLFVALQSRSLYSCVTFTQSSYHSL